MKKTTLDGGPYITLELKVSDKIYILLDVWFMKDGESWDYQNGEKPEMFLFFSVVKLKFIVRKKTISEEIFLTNRT